MQSEKFSYREQPRPEDIEMVRQITASSGFFYADEVETAVELVQERLAKGEASGYYFCFVEQGGRTLGYSCYGPIACTQGSYDLYWIAVHRDCRDQGLGSRLLAASEERMRKMGGRRVYIETSSRPLYEPTRSFYLRRGYSEETVLKDFYAPGDGKVIYLKVLAA